MKPKKEGKEAKEVQKKVNRLSFLAARFSDALASIKSKKFCTEITGINISGPLTSAIHRARLIE